MTPGEDNSIRLHCFNKEERLCSQTAIDKLYREGNRLMIFPYSLRWMVTCETGGAAPYPAQVVVTTSKKKFRHAVDRNRVKRLTRECYRLHKPLLYDQLRQRHLHLVLSISYIHTSIIDFHTLYKKFDKMSVLLVEAIDKSSSTQNNATQCGESSTDF